MIIPLYEVETLEISIFTETADKHTHEHKFSLLHFSLCTVMMLMLMSELVLAYF